MIYKPKNPVGYKTLLTWKQAGEIYRKAKDFTKTYLNNFRDQRLANHINDSGRSVQRNIEEGFKRATTKEYVSFLGFSRASLEELKGDFEELKREYGKGIRGDKGKEGAIRGKVMSEIEGMLDLIYGEDCMMGRQIASLENKMIKEKTMPQGEVIKKNWNKSKRSDEKFWKHVENRFGLKQDESGKVIKKEE
ncbi:MAG: four helix bundle protein [Candidatus Omnitrophica bacterium]|nr:four helix bundle protein [Candidatus Omnitrophota bacterium]